MKPIAKTSLFFLIVAVVAGAGYYLYRSKTTLTPEQRYRLETAEKGDLVQTVSANGTLNPVVLVNVGTQVSGTVTKLYVDFNDKVEKGQPLLELDRSLL
ncbi:MAG: biotin/lipoyl-binding protein, partial [Propionivibrio sp.]